MPRVALAMHGSAMLYEVAIASEIFGVDRSDLSPSGEWYDLVVCTPAGLMHPWLPNLPTASYTEITRVDSVVVPSTDDLDEEPDPELVEALRVAHGRGVRVVSLCTGAFVLAAAGLLDGRVATTHWMHADDLPRRYPQVDVRADVLYIDEGDVLTSAGKTAALDLCIHLVRRDLVATAANGIARRLVVPAHRSGGQAQFIIPPAQPRNPDGLAPTLEWAHQQRIARAPELLERTDASVEEIATSCGMGTPTTLRRHFHRVVGVSPTAYRATFGLA